MALTPSRMVSLGSAAPDFALPDAVDGRVYRLADFAGSPVLVVLFICNHCPYVKHVRAGLARFAGDYGGRGVAVVAINANDAVRHPDDSPARMKEEVRIAGYGFPYLFDESQAVARAYRATCTPDIFVYDAGRRLAYRGQFDDSRPGNGRPVTGADLRAACDALLAGRSPEPGQKPSIGCNIKWKPGAEPSDAG